MNLIKWPSAHSKRQSNERTRVQCAMHNKHIMYAMTVLLCAHIITTIVKSFFYFVYFIHPLLKWGKNARIAIHRLRPALMGHTIIHYAWSRSGLHSWSVNILPHAATNVCIQQRATELMKQIEILCPLGMQTVALSSAAVSIIYFVRSAWWRRRRRVPRILSRGHCRIFLPGVHSSAW